MTGRHTELGQIQELVRDTLTRDAVRPSWAGRDRLVLVAGGSVDWSFSSACSAGRLLPMIASAISPSRPCPVAHRRTTTLALVSAPQRRRALVRRLDAVKPSARSAPSASTRPEPSPQPDDREQAPGRIRSRRAGPQGPRGAQGHSACRGMTCAARHGSPLLGGWVEAARGATPRLADRDRDPPRGRRQRGHRRPRSAPLLDISLRAENRAW
jgi:hypothetical protein